VTHPEELLAGYVDGALDDTQRAVVDAHLPGCALCTEEIDLAQRAKTSLAALEDAPVPFGVTGPVLAEAGRRFERRRGVLWQRLQWSAGLAAAAALVLVVALNIGRGDSEQAAAPASRSEATAPAPEAADAQADAAAPAFLGLERQPNVTYDQAGVEAVAQDAASAIAAAQQGRTAALAGSAAQDAGVGQARRCVTRTGLTDPSDRLVRLIEAEFEGVRAYLAVFAQGPGAGQPPDHVVVYVVATDDCRILSTASLRI
jgi:predicted anti-sigma-YlaC factor YlaD